MPRTRWARLLGLTLALPTAMLWWSSTDEKSFILDEGSLLEGLIVATFYGLKKLLEVMFLLVWLVMSWVSWLSRSMLVACL